MEKKPVTVSDMDELVRVAVSQAREQLKDDHESLASLEHLVRVWNKLCYQLVVSYTGLSLMRLLTAENASSLLEVAHNIMGRKNGTSEAAGPPFLPTDFLN
jgi:hypothetical protein